MTNALPACVVMAAKRVPMAANPTVPSPITTTSAGSAGTRSRLKNTPKRTRSMASTMNISSRLPASLPT